MTSNKTYKWKEDSYYTSNGCDCCEDEWWECYNPLDDVMNQSSQNELIDCYRESIYDYLTYEVTDPLVYYDIMNLLGIDVEIVNEDS